MAVIDSLKLIAAVAFLVGVGAHVARRWWLRAKYDWHLIPGPAPFPVLGHLPYYMSWDKPRQHLMQLEWAKKHGKVFKIESPGVGRVIFVMDPEQIQRSITGHGTRGLPKGTSYRRFRVILSDQDRDSIFTAQSTNNYWKAVRKGAALAFSKEALKAMCPKVAAKVAKLVRVIEGLPAGRPIDVQSLLVRLTLDVIGSAGFDLDFGALEMGPCSLLEAMTYGSADLVATNMNPMRRWTKWLFPGGTLARECRQVHGVLYGEYQWMLKELRGRGVPRSDDVSIWACLSRVRDPGTGAPLDDAALTIELATFLFGGMETTAHQAMWTLYCAATHPEAQRKVVDELEAAGLLACIRAGELDRLGYSDVEGLRYLNAVVKEAIRMFPAAPLGSGRVTVKDGTKVCGYRVPAGTRVVVPIYALCHAPWLFDDPEAFKPERWAKDFGGEGCDGAAESGGRARTFWAFSDGPRDCIGQRLAMIELRFILAILMARFQWRVAADMGKWDDVIARQYSSLVLCVDGGMWLHCDPR